MTLEIFPSQNTDALPMMELVLHILQNYMDSDIYVSPIDETSDIDRLVSRGIRAIYNNPQFALDILREFNINKYNYTIKNS
jgi:hypothetical protein